MEPLSGGSRTPVSWIAVTGVISGVPISSWIDARLLAGYLTVMSAAAAAALSRWWLSGTPVDQIVAAVCCGAFTPAALEYGEAGILWVLGATVIALAGRFAAGGQRTLDTLAAVLAMVMVLGMIGGYLVLGRLLSGTSGLVSLLAMVGAFIGVPALVRVRAGIGWAAVACGSCVVVAVVGLRLGGVPIDLGARAVVGAAVAAAALLGTEVGRVMGIELPGERGAVPGAGNLLYIVTVGMLAVPTYYYCINLFLR